MLSNVFNAGKDIANKIGNKIMNLSEIEAKIKESTNDDPWGPQAYIMQEIAVETFSSMNFNETMNFLWYRIFTERPLNSRRTYKGLLLLSYIILNGSDYVSLRSKDYIDDIRRLVTFSDGNGVHDPSIRKKASDILDLLTNNSRLQSEREKAKNSQVKVYSKNLSIDSLDGAQCHSNAAAPRLGDFESWQPRSKSIPVVIGESFINLVTTLTQNISGPPSTETHDNFDLPSYYQMENCAGIKADPLPGKIVANTSSTGPKDAIINQNKGLPTTEMIGDNERPIIDFTDVIIDDRKGMQEDDFGDFRSWNSTIISTSERVDVGDFFPDFDNLNRSHTNTDHKDPIISNNSETVSSGHDHGQPRPDLKLGSTWNDLGSLKIDLDNVCGCRHPMYSKS